MGVVFDKFYPKQMITAYLQSLAKSSSSTSTSTSSTHTSKQQKYVKNTPTPTPTYKSLSSKPSRIVVHKTPKPPSTKKGVPKTPQSTRSAVDQHKDSKGIPPYLIINQDFGLPKFSDRPIQLPHSMR
jgi:hypothetical protein